MVTSLSNEHVHPNRTSHLQKEQLKLPPIYRECNDQQDRWDQEEDQSELDAAVVCRNTTYINEITDYATVMQNDVDELGDEQVDLKEFLLLCFVEATNLVRLCFLLFVNISVAPLWWRLLFRFIKLEATFFAESKRSPKELKK